MFFNNYNKSKNKFLTQNNSLLNPLSPTKMIKKELKRRKTKKHLYLLTIIHTLLENKRDQRISELNFLPGNTKDDSFYYFKERAQFEKIATYTKQIEDLDDEIWLSQLQLEEIRREKHCFGPRK